MMNKNLPCSKDIDSWFDFKTSLTQTSFFHFKPVLLYMSKTKAYKIHHMQTNTNNCKSKLGTHKSISKEI